MLPVDLHMDFNIEKSLLVLLILVLVSLSQSSIVVTLIPRYVNSQRPLVACYSTVLVFMRRTLIFMLVFIFSPMLTVELSCSVFC